MDLGSAPLVDAARAGDRDAFCQLVEMHQDAVRSFLAARAPSVELIEELVQAAFVTAWERLSAFDGVGPFAGWVIGIARNHLREELRRQRRTVPLDAAAVQSVLLDACLADAEREETAWEIARLQRCIDRLPMHGREVIRRRYLHGHSLAQLAIAFKRPAGAVATALHRLRSALLDCLGGSPT